MITISAFKWVPEFAQGYVRDLRVRWALEEAGRVDEGPARAAVHHRDSRPRHRQFRPDAGS